MLYLFENMAMTDFYFISLLTLGTLR
jgi:hypothetical protein